MRVQIPENLLVCSVERATANELLLSAFRLEVGDFDLNSFGKVWVRNWYYLPQITYLIGCHTLRAELARKGGILKLPIWAIKFLAIDLPTGGYINQSAYVKSSPNHEDLMRIGYARLFAWNSQLPQPLRQRFPLLFAPHVDKAIPQPAVDSLTLTLAIQHAQIYPNPPP